MDDLKYFIKCFMPVLILIVLAAALCVLGVGWCEKYSSDQYEKVTGRETKFVLLNECFINDGTNWLREDEYKAGLIAREGLQSINN